MTSKKLLKVLSAATIFSGLIAACGSMVVYKKRIKFLEDKNVKFKKYYNLLNEWMKQDKTGGKLADYLKKNGLSKIALYGMGEIGQRVYEELKDTEIDVLYGIDQFGNTELELEIVEPDEIDTIKEFIDGIIVTAIADYETILENISEEDLKVISLEEIIYNL